MYEDLSSNTENTTDNVLQGSPRSLHVQVNYAGKSVNGHKELRQV